MPALETRRHAPRFQGLFPDWTDPRPVTWYFGEQLLAARSESRFPTNAEEPDEEVNVYLIHLLTSFLDGAADPQVRPGVEPLLNAPAPTLSRRERAAFYRVNADHRLLHLGLMDRGESLRRRDVPLGASTVSVRRRDLETGRECYAMAANLLAGRCGADPTFVRVLRLLADHFGDYVHVLTVLARRRWRLGAVLQDNDLAALVTYPDTGKLPDEIATMDGLLDLVVEYGKRPTPGLAARIRHWADVLAVDLVVPGADG